MSSPKWTRLQFGMRRPGSRTLSNRCPRTCRKRSRNGSKKTAAHNGSKFHFPKLAGSAGGQIRISDQPPLIFHPATTRAREAEVILHRLFDAHRESLSDDRRVLHERYRLVDVAIKVVGVGSVGRRCWIALTMSEANRPLFLQFKEVANSVLEPCAGRSAYRHHGRRVVMGQRLTQPLRTFSPAGRLLQMADSFMCDSCTMPRSSPWWRLSTPTCWMFMPRLAVGYSLALMQRRVKSPQRSAGISVLQTTRSMSLSGNLHWPMQIKPSISCRA